MTWLVAVLAAVVLTCCTVRTAAADPPSGDRSATLADPDQLATTLRELLLRHVPDPIVQSSHGWGDRKAHAVVGRFRSGRAEPVTEWRNDGTWRRIAVRAPNLAHTLKVGVKDVCSPQPGTLRFTALIGVGCDIKFEQQVWKRGVRLYSGETRGRCRAAVALRCEVASRIEPKPGSPLPDVVLRVRVTEAQLFYDDLVIEHTAGVGGDAARLLGDAVVGAIKQAKPSLERDLLARANAAVVKAADTKEVRVCLGRLLEGKAPAVERLKSPPGR